jgi:hypothetical protein
MPSISELLVAVVFLHLLLVLVVALSLSLASGTIRLLILCRKLVLAFAGSLWLFGIAAHLFFLAKKL